MSPHRMLDVWAAVVWHRALGGHGIPNRDATLEWEWGDPRTIGAEARSGGHPASARLIAATVEQAIKAAAEGHELGARSIRLALLYDYPRDGQFHGLKPIGPRPRASTRRRMARIVMRFL